MDFPTLLVILTFITGGVWGLDLLWWARKRRAEIATLKAAGSPPEAVERAAKEPLMVEYARAFFPIILIVLVIRSFLAEPFRIPSGSMMPTLLTGDFILVNKFAYGLRLPVINSKVLSLGDPQRGDIIVFRYPEDPSLDYIKRVIGVPGDSISYRNKTLLINGQRIPQTLVGTYTGEGSSASMNGANVRHEKIEDEEFNILIMTSRFDRDFDVKVPEGQYFVMGDNRDNSRDSRFWGFVPDRNLVGKAFMIWMSWDSAAGGVAWRRIGTILN